MGTSRLSSSAGSSSGKGRSSLEARHSSSSPSAVPTWVSAAMAEDRLAQPWKQHAHAEVDDPNYAQTKDTVTFDDQAIKVCYSENTCLQWIYVCLNPMDVHQ
ncbi:hypothetical protein BX600DRAFT_505897 [Xylariales sp. PMI_506]|nr:hypothetical protein BX600DRAFT_505897 [Xylariales sp. PMI_506]